LFILEVTFDFDSSNSNVLIILSFSLIFFNNYLTEGFLIVAFGVESLLVEEKLSLS